MDYSDKYHWTFEIFDQLIDKYLAQGYSVIADTNADKYEIRKKYYQLAEKRDALVQAFWLQADIKLLEERQKKRERRDSHQLREDYLYSHSKEELEEYKAKLEEPKEEEKVYIIDGSKELAVQLDNWEEEVKDKKGVIKLKEQTMLQLFQQYTAGWEEGDKEKIIDCLSSNCRITECNGQRFEGLEQVNKWFADWEEEGNEVTQWEIKNGYYDLDFQVAVFEWIFTCLAEGNKYHFKGTSVVKYKEELITEMSEYRMEAEHYFPYG